MQVGRRRNLRVHPSVRTSRVCRNLKSDSDLCPSRGAGQSAGSASQCFHRPVLHQHLAPPSWRTMHRPLRLSMTVQEPGGFEPWPPCWRRWPEQATRFSSQGRSWRWRKGKLRCTPYLARQMSDFGFRQTLEVRTLGCARRSHPHPTHVSPPR